MKLLDMCQYVTFYNNDLLTPDHPMHSRLVCPEYSKSVEEVKNDGLVAVS